MENLNLKYLAALETAFLTAVTKNLSQYMPGNPWRMIGGKSVEFYSPVGQRIVICLDYEVLSDNVTVTPKPMMQTGDVMTTEPMKLVETLQTVATIIKFASKDMEKLPFYGELV